MYTLLPDVSPSCSCIQYRICHSGTEKPCGAEQRTPRCSKTCESNYSVSFEDDKHYGVSAYSVSGMVSKIQTEIMTNGPVEGTFTVYEDFLPYKTGMCVIIH